VTTFTRVTVTLASFALITRAAAAQQMSALDTSGGRGRSASRATVHATAIRTAVTLDGRLDESFWATADSIDDFRQREPLEGSSATEHTVVKVAHDAAALYIAVRCDDSNMRGVRASQLRRDADLSSDDNVRLLIDSFDDRRSAFVFGTNPNGAMWDAQFSGVDDLNENWNGVWDVAVSRDSAGWTAEFRIPLLALRFHAGTNAEFGFNVRRFIRRKNEEDLWRSYGRAQGLYHLANEGSDHRPRGPPPPARSRGVPVCARPSRGDRTRQRRWRDDARLRRGEGRSRCQARHHPDVDRGRHRQHRLRAGGSRPAGHQPHPVSLFLPREARVLP